MYSVDFHWSGCSCGCTTSEIITLESKTKDGLVYGLAECYSKHRVYGNNPYRKCYFREDDATGCIGIKEELVIEISNKLCKLDEEINQLEQDAKKPFVAPFICADGFSLSKEQLDVNSHNLEMHQLNLKKINDNISALKDQQRKMYIEHRSEEHCEDNY